MPDNSKMESIRGNSRLMSYIVIIVKDKVDPETKNIRFEPGISKLKFYPETNLQMELKPSLLYRINTVILI